MSDTAKAFLRWLVPAAVRRGVRNVCDWKWFEGNYPDWEAARRASTGYDDAAIVARVLSATLAVKEGRAAFERDGVVFPHAVDEPGLTAAFAQVARDCAAPVRVLDFGGSLGTTYWRHRRGLARVATWRWDVIEQPRFVAVGREYVADECLRFFGSIDEAAAAGEHDVVLLSNVLQYLPQPRTILARCAEIGARWILINNLPVHRRETDRIAVQRVPPSIYPASYPVWFFNRDRLFEVLESRYVLTTEFASEAIWPVGWRSYRSTGTLWRRRDGP